jgi:glycosyltransferase involved in cell wall biosynthesis
MSPPPVSVLVPVHNDARYLDASLGSIAAQSFENFEVIMSDDCSTDGSLELCREWAGRDSRFRLIRNETNLGMTQNWNRALAESRGPYVVKLDADDLMRPRFLEILEGELERDPDIGAVFCRSLDCDESLEPYGSYLGEQVFYRRGLNPLERHLKPGWEWYRLCFDGYQLWSANAQMYRKELLESAGGWDERWGCASDTDLILRILETDEPVLHHPYCGIWYRRREGSVSHSYEMSGWKTIEGVLAHLLSLQRQFGTRGGLGRDLWRSWHRYWVVWSRLVRKVREQGNTLPPGLKGSGLDALERQVRPALSVRMGFSIASILGKLKRETTRYARLCSQMSRRTSQ